jgi:hypothetical protein
MYEKYKGKIPNGMQVLHNCPGGDNSQCINPDHLWCGNQEQNNADRAMKKRNGILSGENNGRHKITENTVRIIRNSSKSINELALEFGISHDHVYKILNKRAWRGVA